MLALPVVWPRGEHELAPKTRPELGDVRDVGTVGPDVAGPRQPPQPS